MPWKRNNVFPLCRRPTDVSVNNINTERVTMETQQWVLFSAVVKLKYFILLTSLQLSIPDEDSDVMATSYLWQQREYSDIHVKHPTIFDRFETNLSVDDRVAYKSSTSNFTKIRPLEAELLREGQTERHDEAKRRFSRLTFKEPKSWPWPSLGSSRFAPVQPYKWPSPCSEILLSE